MVGNTYAPAEHTALSDDDTTRQAGMGCNDTIPANDHVVGDLYEIVDLGILADDSVVQGAAVDTRIGANRHAILDDDTSKLRNVNNTARTGRSAKTRLSHNGPCIDPHPVADQRKADDRAGTHIAVAANRNTRSDHSASRNVSAATDHRAWPNSGARRYYDSLPPSPHRGWTEADPGG